MRLITLDMETHYSTEYSLSRMSPLEYVRDPRFQLISCSIKVDDYNTDVFFGREKVEHAFGKLQPIIKDALVIAHNMSGFDAYVCAYALGLRPKMWGCTLAMARPVHAKTVGLGLAALVKHYQKELEAMGIAGAKDNSVLVQTRGKRLEDFTPAELEAMRTYNRNDTDQCWGLFKLLREHYTPAELWQIDALIRMRTEPQFELDVPLLETAASVERTRKHKALLDLAGSLRKTAVIADGAVEALDWSDEDAVAESVRADLASAPKFSALLEGLGVEVPMKPSPTNPARLVPALSKTDEAFTDLQEHENPLVAAAARARLGVKSTLLETRIEKFLTAGRLAGGMLPIPLRYCGADTTGRDSGEEYNPQNQPRIDPDKPKVSDCLRNSLRAPRGKKVIVADQSGIELRVNHFLWKVPSSTELYEASPAKADLYRAFAAESLFKVPPEQISKSQRQLGKVAQLGLGFGAGGPAFQRVARTMGGIRLHLNREEYDGPELTAEEVVASWRESYNPIVQGWRACAKGVLHIADGFEAAVDPWGLVHTSREGFVLPSGRLIRYPELREEDDGHWPDGRPRRSWFYGVGRHKARITGPKADENIVQALARDSIFDCAIEFFRRTGLRPALRVHDELVYVVDEGPAEELLAELQATLRTPPKWWPQLIVWSEGDVADTYGAAK